MSKISYIRTEKIRMKQSDSMKDMYRKNPEKKPIGRKNGMYGKNPSLLSILEANIIRSTIPGCNKGRGSGWNHSKKTKNRISDMRLHKIKSGEIVYPVGDLHPQYGKHQSVNRRMKISIANTGKVRSAKMRKEMSDRVSGKKNPFYGKKHTEKSLKSILKAIRKRPTRFELAVQHFLEMNYPGEWKYCGDGSVILNGKCPDFINCNGQKKVVLANSVYWHLTKKGLNRKQCERIESKPYNEMGFDVWFIWDDVERRV